MVLSSKCTIAVVLLCLSVLHSSLLSAESEKPRPIGSITALEGKAKSRDSSGQKTQLDTGMPIFLSDTIYTGRRSKVSITFKDGTEITIGAKANLVIDEFAYNPADKKGICKTSLTRGAFKILGGQISKTDLDKISVKTPVCYIGIRGTTCIGTASAAKTTTVFTEGTAISVSNNLGSTLLTGKSGMGCETFKGKAPGSARQFSPGEIAKINAQITIVSSHGHTAGTTQTGARRSERSGRTGRHSPRGPHTTPSRRPSGGGHHH
ncbi:MAG: FecR family protein [Planctomycetota bacterium]|jgi:hypothetical protein